MEPAVNFGLNNMANSLKEYLSKRRKDEEKSKRVWAESVQKWHRALADLYDHVETWTAASQTAGLLQCCREPVRMDEEEVGAYETERLVMCFGPTRLTLEPKGMRIIGANGRVDLEGRGKSIKLVLSKNTWHIAEDRPKPLLSPLTESSFTAAIESLLE